MTDAADAVARGPDADASAVASSESLFDAMIVARAKGLAREVSRLVYVAPTGPSAAGGAAGGETPGRGAAAAAADSLHARLVQQQVASDGQGSVTGVLLALPGCVAHLLEGRSEALQRILGGLRAQRVGGPAGGGAASGPAADEAPEADACVRVVYFAEQLPGRCCSGWSIIGHPGGARAAGGGGSNADAAGAAGGARRAQAVVQALRQLAAARQSDAAICCEQDVLQLAACELFPSVCQLAW